MYNQYSITYGKRSDAVSFTLGHSNLITCLTSFFWKTNPVRLQIKRKKSHLWCLTDESGFEIFCQKKKSGIPPTLQVTGINRLIDFIKLRIGW